MDGITALVKGKNKEVAEVAKKAMKKLKEEVEKKGLKLSLTENGKEGKSKMIASSGFLENELAILRWCTLLTNWCQQWSCRNRSHHRHSRAGAGPQRPSL